MALLVLRPGENVDIVFRGSSHNVSISHGEEGPHRHSRYGNGLNDLAVLAAEDFDTEVFPQAATLPSGREDTE